MSQYKKGRNIDSFQEITFVLNSSDTLETKRNNHDLEDTIWSERGDRFIMCFETPSLILKYRCPLMSLIKMKSLSI